MAYHILRLSSVSPDAYPLYFLDSNVWIYKLQPRKVLSPYAIPYVDFVEEVINLHHNGSLVTPKFVWTSTLLSEVINAMLKVECKKYQQSLHPPPRTFDYKKDFRPTPAFTKALNRIRSDLQGLEPYVEIQDDGFSGLDVFGTLLPDVTSANDFTDLLYARQMLPQGIPVVTNDGDFVFEGLVVITNHPSLLKIK